MDVNPALVHNGVVAIGCAVPARVFNALVLALGIVVLTADDPVMRCDQVYILSHQAEAG